MRRPLRSAAQSVYESVQRVNSPRPALLAVPRLSCSLAPSLLPGDRPPTSLDMPTTPPNPNERLAGFLRANGVPARVEGDWVQLTSYPRRLRLLVLDVAPTATGVRLQLGVDFEPWRGRLLRERFEGNGHTEFEAVGDAMLAFTSTSLHVLLGAFAGVRDDDRISTELWSIGGTQRRVVLGHESRSGTRPADQLDWYRAMVRFIHEFGLPEGTHTIRVELTRGDGVQCEVLLDGQPWPRLQTALLGLNWKPVAGVAIARRFLVAQGGLDVGQAVALIATKPTLDDQALRQFLEKQQLSPHDASRAVAFVPLAFGRVLLRSLGVTFDDAALIETNGQRREVQLSSEPVFAEATRLAEDAFTQGTLSKELFTAVAMRSAEVAAVNAALNAGHPAQSLVTAPPVLAIAEDAKIAEAAAKPWWRFW